MQTIVMKVVMNVGKRRKVDILFKTRVETSGVFNNSSKYGSRIVCKASTSLRFMIKHIPL